MLTFKEFLTESPADDIAKVKFANQVWDALFAGVTPTNIEARREMMNGPAGFVTTIVYVINAATKLSGEYNDDVKNFELWLVPEYKNLGSSKAFFTREKYSKKQLIVIGLDGLSATSPFGRKKPSDVTVIEKILSHANSQTYKEYFVHEYTHLLDSIRFKDGSFFDKEKANKRESSKENYYGSDVEYNAHFQEGIFRLTSTIDHIKTLASKPKLSASAKYDAEDLVKIGLKFDGFLRLCADRVIFSEAFLKYLGSDKTTKFYKRLYKFWDEQVKPELELLRDRLKG